MHTLQTCRPDVCLQKRFLQGLSRERSKASTQSPKMGDSPGDVHVHQEQRPAPEGSYDHTMFKVLLHGVQAPTVPQWPEPGRTERPQSAASQHPGWLRGSCWAEKGGLGRGGTFTKGAHRSAYRPCCTPPRLATAAATSAACFTTAFPLPS